MGIVLRGLVWVCFFFFFSGVEGTGRIQLHSSDVSSGVGGL